MSVGMCEDVLLGQVVDEQGEIPVPNKIKRIIQAEIRSNRMYLKSFNGLEGY